MKRFYKIDFEAKYIDTYPGSTKEPYTYSEDESMTVIAGDDAEKAIAIARKKRLGKVTRGSYDDDAGSMVRFVSKCIALKISSVIIKAEADV